MDSGIWQQEIQDLDYGQLFFSSSFCYILGILQWQTDFSQNSDKDIDRI